MRSFADYFSTASDNYRAFRPDYPADFFEYLATISPSKKKAWDCGCGNGQASVALAKHFECVTATDASEKQISQAIQKDNITYAVSPAEIIDAEDHTLDLVTVAQAIHWFDHDIFFKEVNRVLKPGGVLAAWGYQLLYTDTELDNVVSHFHSQVVGPYWPKGRELLDEGYTKINFPYDRLTPPEFFMRKEWEFGHLLGYLNTWSAVKGYEQEKKENPVEKYFEELKIAWGDEARHKKIYWPLILYVGQKQLG
ncbi:MAG: class I SAM-dependent methyltransferase [Cellvibrionaceae bacterium]